MPEAFWAACAFVLVLEGLLPLIAPGVWRNAFRHLIDLSDGQLRFIGLTAVAFGGLLLLAFYA